MNMKKPLLAIAVVSFSLLPLGREAFATDIKVIPATACQPRTPDEALNVTFDNGVLLNKSNTLKAFIFCPFVRDNPKGIGETFSAVIEVQGFKGQEVGCTLTNRASSGHPFSPDDFGSGGANGPESIALNLKAANSFGSYFTIDCLLPPLGQVFSYRTFEPSPTDDD
jgi:hypothetical protein